MNKYIYIFLIGIILQSCSSKTMTTMGGKVKHPITKTPYYKSLNFYQQDFLFLSTVLEESYPRIFEDIDKADFDKYKSQSLSSLRTVNNKDDFAFITQKFLVRL